MSQEHKSQEQSAAGKEQNTTPPAFLMTQDNQPFANESSASRALRQRGLDEDMYAIKPQGDGYVAILKVMDATAPEPEPDEADKGDKPKPTKQTAANKEEYFRVKFQPKSDANQPDEVILSVNGEVLQITRNVEVIIPKRFKECADNGVTAQFKQLPGQTRKVIGEVRTFPYDLLGPATEKEFIAMKQEGTRLARQSVESAGI